ncbi:MAG TPA: IS6 family transposase [Chloroflexota bacterium]|nr:IS6 family transposase [Chloroflexota bacterium]
MSYKRHRFPAEIIAHCVWLYHRFSLSLRDVQELMAERGVAVTYETVHQWCQKFGPLFAIELKRRRPKPGDKWPVEEVQLKINGKRHWLWRAVDQDGLVLEILVQPRRNRKAAERFLRQVVDGCGTCPRVVVTDKLASYPPALRRVLPGVDHRRHKGLNNRAENSHRPTRRRERAMQRFTSPEQAQQFLAAFEPIRGHFCPRRHRLSATHYRTVLAARFQTWRQVTGVTTGA